MKVCFWDKSYGVFIRYVCTFLVRVVINIEDLNDNAPIFREETLNSSKQVIEHSVKGTVIATLVADDADGPKYNKVLYSIK